MSSAHASTASVLDQNLVDEADEHIATSGNTMLRVLGRSHLLYHEFNLCAARSSYKLHFFGKDRSREWLIETIEGQTQSLRLSTKILGVEHPTTLAIRASLKLCFEEQLDWTLDDIPRRIFETLDEIPRLPGHKVFGSNPSLWEASGM